VVLRARPSPRCVGTGGPKHGDDPWRATPPGLPGNAEGSELPSPQRRWQGGRSCLLLVALLLFLTAHWRCRSWAAEQERSAFKGTLGGLFVNAQRSFLTATFLLSLLPLGLGSAWAPTHKKHLPHHVDKTHKFDLRLPHVQVLPTSPFQPRATGQAPSRVLIENLCMKAVNQSIGNSSFLGQPGGHKM